MYSPEISPILGPPESEEVLLRLANKMTGLYCPIYCLSAGSEIPLNAVAKKVTSFVLSFGHNCVCVRRHHLGTLLLLLEYLLIRTGSDGSVLDLHVATGLFDS